MNRETEWIELVDRFLPIADGAVWRFSRHAHELPREGFKLHLSATALTAPALLRVVAPLLQGEVFKAPATLELIRQLNCGLFFGFSQIGKVITVYPRTTTRAVELADLLDGATRGLAAPLVPFDGRFADSRVVSYRWGAFSARGDGSAHLMRPDGVEVPDDRAPSRVVPDWVVDALSRPRARSTSRLRLIKAFQVLAQRGKGGVYRALDLESDPARVCVMKEGRRHGETEGDGSDGFDRVVREERVLQFLHEAGAPVPRVWSSFEEGGARFLLLEDLGERTLLTLIDEAKSWSEAERHAAVVRLLPRLAGAVAKVHAAGLAWRDVKPHNVVLSADDSVNLIDFEGACPCDDASAGLWGSPGYIPADAASDWKAADVYAVGMSLAQLAAGELGLPDEPNLPACLRPLLLVDAAARPSARDLSLR